MTFEQPQLHRVGIWEDTGLVCMARLVTDANVNVVQADISSIAYSVFDLVTRTADVISGTSLTVSAVIFDTLQTDARWSTDSTGYNFRWTVPATAFPTGGRSYRVEFKFTPASGQVFFVSYEVDVSEIMTS